MTLGGRVTDHKPVKSPGELENQCKREEERGRLRVCAGAGEKRIMFHTARIRLSM